MFLNFKVIFSFSLVGEGIIVAAIIMELTSLFRNIKKSELLNFKCTFPRINKTNKYTLFSLKPPSFWLEEIN